MRILRGRIEGKNVAVLLSVRERVALAVSAF